LLRGFGKMIIIELRLGKGSGNTATLQSNSRAGSTALCRQQSELHDQHPIYPLPEASGDWGFVELLLGQDMWKQLKRVTLPEFSGDKKTYQNWKAASQLVWTRHLLSRVQATTATPMSHWRSFEGYLEFRSLSHCLQSSER